MTAVVLYESEFGATRVIAEAIAEGMRLVAPAEAVDVRDQPHRLDMDVDVLVLGAPTHVRSLPSVASRAEARSWPDREASALTLEPGADQPGMREWLADQDLDGVSCIAFATRMNVGRVFSGSAVPAIEREVRAAGATIGARSETFVVEMNAGLVEGERERAEGWGFSLASNIQRAWTGGLPEPDGSITPEL